LQKLKTATGAAWKEARDGLSTAWNEIETSFQKAKAEVEQA
jgi:hypothetical protein